MTMRQRIAKHEQTLRNPDLGSLAAVGTRVRLFLTYLQYAFVHSFTLLFLHPTKSFVALNDPAGNGLWRRSYIEHLAYRNQVRFASLSGFFVLLTAAVATFAIVITVFPDRGVSPVYAASIVVNSNNDLDDGTCNAAHCSLREAIVQANTAAGADTITFNAAMTITPTSALTALIGDATTIKGDGLVTINGSAAGSSKLGLDIQADNITIQGLTITSFTASGISIGVTADNTVIGGTSAAEGNVIHANGESGVVVSGGTGNKIIGNKIGQKADGSLSQNSQFGVLVMAGSNTSIGDASTTNYITEGVSLGLNSGTVTVYGNVIGASSTGVTGVSANNGIANSGDNNVIGGTGAGQRNYVVGFSNHGILVDGNASGTSIVGNYIGVTSSGTAKGHAGHGIKVIKAAGTTITSNTIAGNSSNGIYLTLISSGTNTISSNTIGVLPSGVAAGNTASGIYVESSSNVTVTGNVVGNSGGSGIHVDDSSISVTGNYVGLDKASTSIPNGKDGIAVEGAASGVEIGGSQADRNFVANNVEAGILVLSGATGTPTISYNYVGVDVDGTAAAGNGSGIDLDAPALVNNNLVSGNIGIGITIDADSATVTSNIVGLNSAEDATLGNGSDGINVVAGRSSNIIGLVGEGNTVAGNAGAQILIDDSGNGNSVTGNYINCNTACTELVDSGQPGVVVQGSIDTSVTGNFIGGNTAPESSDSRGAAVLIISGASSTVLTSNVIGQGTGGEDISGGGLIGILVLESDGQTIGTTDAGNTLANFGTGIVVDASQQVGIRGNTLAGNTILFSLLNDANNGIESPVILVADENGASGTSSVSGTIDLYEDGVYVASGESDGTWEITVTLDTSLTILATITDSDGNTSDFGTYSAGGDTTAPESSASPAGGTYSGTQTVTLTATDNVDTAPKIYYTTDGTTPTTTSSEYSSALTIAGDTTLQFFALDASDNAEAVNTEIYNITQDKADIFDGDHLSVKADDQTIHPECATCTVRITDTTPTFLGVVSKSLIDYIVRLVIFASTTQEDGTQELDKVFAQNKSIIQNPKNSNNAVWKITVPENKALDVGEYVVKVGLRDPDGAVVKPMRKKVSLAVTPSNPVLVSPQALVYTETPAFVGNALNDMRVIARVFQDETEVGHCQTDVVNSDTGTGSFSCSLPFELKAGQYTARVNVQDPVSELISSGSEVAFSVSKPTPVAENVPFSLVSGEVSIQSQSLTIDNTPVFVGLATNDTEVVLVVDGTKLFTATLTNDDSGVGHWEVTTSFLADGAHTAYAMVRSGGVELNRTETLQFRIVPPTVVPTITSPAAGARVALGQQIVFTVLGHSGDSVELSLSGSTDISVNNIFSEDTSGTGSATFTFSNGLPRGEWTVTATATDASGKPSLPSEELSFRVYVPVSTTPSEPTEEPTNTNGTPTNTNEEPTNTNETPTNTNETPVNTNEEPTNVNEVPTNTNEVPTNTNEEPTNVNEVPSNVNEVPTNTNEVPTGNVNETPSEREPLPEPPPAFTFPEGVENFPIIDKTPEDLTSEEVKAVRIVLNSYLKSELQILPVEQEGNAMYLITEKNADNQPVLTVAQEVGLESSSGLTKALNNTLRLFGFQQFKQTDSLLIFRGTTVPYATVKLTIFSDPIVKIAQADADGRWTMTVAADTLPPGDHSAYVQTSYGEAESEEVQIARFVVVQQERLSNTTWLFIINLGVILIVLLAAIFLQLRKRTQLLEIKKAAIPAESPWKSGSVNLPKKEDNSKKPKGPDDLGDIMGI